MALQRTSAVVVREKAFVKYMGLRDRFLAINCHLL